MTIVVKHGRVARRLPGTFSIVGSFRDMKALAEALEPYLRMDAERQIDQMYWRCEVRPPEYTAEPALKEWDEDDD